MNVTYKTAEIPGVNLYDLLDGKDVKYSAEINTQASPLLNFLLTWICRVITLCGNRTAHGRSLMKRMGGGPGNAIDVWQVECERLCRIRAGYHICVMWLARKSEGNAVKKEIVDFLHKPEKYTEHRCGAAEGRPVSRDLLPEPVKQLRRTAVAGEAHVPFFSISVRKFCVNVVGMVRRRCCDLFKQANEKRVYRIYRRDRYDW